MVVKKGRKQHSLTDIMGLLLAVKAQEANNQDSIAGESVLGKLQWCFERWSIFFAEGAYRGELASRIEGVYEWIIEIVLRSDDIKGFVVIPKRSVVECAFSWFQCERSLAKDYEFLNEST